MDRTKSTWLTELSFIAVLPTIIYIVFASSSVWATGNPVWGNFYEFFSSPERLQVFNVVAAILFVGGTLVSFLLSLTSVGLHLSEEAREDANHAQVNVLNFALTLLTGTLLASLMMFYVGVNVFAIFI